jgi:hypothetical protein
MLPDLENIKKVFLKKYIKKAKTNKAKVAAASSNSTFQTKKVVEIDISFVEYSASKSVQLTPDIVEIQYRG